MEAIIVFGFDGAEWIEAGKAGASEAIGGIIIPSASLAADAGTDEHVAGEVAHSGPLLKRGRKSPNFRPLRRISWWRR